MSKKDTRGGDEKWKLSHLPQGTGDNFTKYVVPLARRKAGMLLPWADLSVPQIQTIVDEVFEVDEHIVQEDDVWTGLVSFWLLGATLIY